MRKHLFLLVLISATCLFAFTQPPPQTKTATHLNNLTLFREVFGDQNYPKAVAEDLSTDDNVYGCTSKLVAIRDSAQSFRYSNSISSLSLQGFGFTIPDDATIQNISVRIRRFKNGRPPVGDLILSLMQRYQEVVDTPSHYGRFWTYLDDYPGKIYPDTEGEFTFSQSGSGNDGGFNHDEPYQWTPAMVNHIRFGVRIENFPPVGHGSVAICYDLVAVTIQYTLPPAVAAKSTSAVEAPLKQPIVYPNPFTRKANIQFTASENGKTVVELYNINGVKLRTLFSGYAVRGQVYNIEVGDAWLPKGMYIYLLRSGIATKTGRVIKLE